MENSFFGIVGASSQAEEVLDFIPFGSVRFFLSNYSDEIGSSIQEIPIKNIESSEDLVTSVPVLVALGAPGLKRKLLKSWKGKLSVPLIAASAQVSRRCSVGLGSILAPNSVIMTNVRIGKSVLVNISATVSHDSVIGDFCTISPGVNIGGNCTIQDGVFIGIGATVIQGIEIAAGSYIAAGAVVTENITKPGTYVGVPAKYKNQNNIWAMSV